MKIELAMVVLVAAIVAKANEINYNHPVRTAKEDEVRHLPDPDQRMNSKLFAGYLKAFKDGEREQWLYYWFVESQSSPATDPVVLWLNGGPGGSSLTGAFNNMGPFRGFSNGSIVVDDEFSWNKIANMLFIEGPIGIGYSYSNEPILEVDDDLTAKANYLALKSFMKKFPHYKKNPLYLTGVSYAGVYLPTLGYYVDQDRKLNLKGIAITNGLFNRYLQMLTMPISAYYHGLIGEEKWKSLSEACCQGLPPTKESCLMSRLSKDCILHLYETEAYLDETLNIKNIFAPKTNSSQTSLRISEQGGCDYLTCQPLRGEIVELPREAFHIPSEFAQAKGIVYRLKYALKPDGLKDEVISLIKSSRNLTMLVLNGDADLRCDFLESRWFVEELGREPIGLYEPWKVDGHLAGFMQHYDGITYATVLGGSHTVDDNRPREAFALFENFLQSRGSRNVLGLQSGSRRE